MLVVLLTLLPSVLSGIIYQSNFSTTACSPLTKSELQLQATVAERKARTPRQVAAFYTPDTFLSELLLISQMYFNAHSTAISQFESLFTKPAGVRDDFERTFKKFFGKLRVVADLIPGGGPAFDVLVKVMNMLEEPSLAVRQAKASGSDFRSCATILRSNLVFTSQKMSTDALDAHRELTTLYNSGTTDQTELLFEAYSIATAGFEFFEPLRVVQNGIIGGYLEARKSKVQSLTITGAYEAFGGLTFTNSQFGSGNTSPITVFSDLIRFNNNCFDTNFLGLGFSWVTKWVGTNEWTLICEYDSERRLITPGCVQNQFPPPDCTDCPWAHSITTNTPIYMDEIRS